MGHRNAVGVDLAFFEERRDVAMNMDLGRDPQHHREHARDQSPQDCKRRLEDAHPSFVLLLGFREPDAQQHGHRGPGAKTVILHARSESEREKKQDES